MLTALFPLPSRLLSEAVAFEMKESAALLASLSNLKLSSESSLVHPLSKQCNKLARFDFQMFPSAVKTPSPEKFLKWSYAGLLMAPKNSAIEDLFLPLAGWDDFDFADKLLFPVRIALAGIGCATCTTFVDTP
jgi:hypothetical protein